MNKVDIARLVLEYLRVVVSWPVATFVLGIVVITRFKVPVEALIGRIASIKVPGIGEFMLTQSARNLAEQLGPANPPPNEPENPPAIASTPTNQAAPPAVPEQGNQPGPASAQDAAAFRAERERAYLWEYRYLNHFLVPRTQYVLDWLASRTDQQPLSYTSYDAWLLPFVPDPTERAAIIDALRQHHLIQIDPNGVITVSPKGREYIQWRGPADVVARIWTAMRLNPPPPPPSSPSHEVNSAGG